jgi:hypothetical protein
MILKGDVWGWLSVAGCLMLVGSWQLAVGSWQLAVGSWKLKPYKILINFVLLLK